MEYPDEIIEAIIDEVINLHDKKQYKGFYRILWIDQQFRAIAFERLSAQNIASNGFHRILSCQLSRNPSSLSQIKSITVG